jgi:hypothetical protein
MSLDGRDGRLTVLGILQPHIEFFAEQTAGQATIDR